MSGLNEQLNPRHHFPAKQDHRLATSAAVDAYFAGVPIVSVLDLNTLNLIPLRGCEGVLFASTPEKLAAALASPAAALRTRDDRHKFFTLDPELPRWRKLILDAVT